MSDRPTDQWGPEDGLWWGLCFHGEEGSLRGREEGRRPGDSKQRGHGEKSVLVSLGSVEVGQMGTGTEGNFGWFKQAQVGMP